MLPAAVITRKASIGVLDHILRFVWRHVMPANVLFV
jgi:hypothetical protein